VITLPFIVVFAVYPVRGQLCFINGAWCTFDGSYWKTAAELHNHSSEYFSKSEVEALLAAQVPAVAGKLATPVMIGDQAFDGSANIQLFRQDNVLFLQPTWTESGVAAHAQGCLGNPASCGYGKWALRVPEEGTWLYYDCNGKYMGFSPGGMSLISQVSTARANSYRACQNPAPHRIMFIKVA
jgi:hypothetical protein